MDFKRIIALLTAFFLVFDGYLAYRVYQQIQVTTVKTRDYQQQSIEQRLTARGIVILNPLSEVNDIGTLMKSEDTQLLRDQMVQLSNQTVSFEEQKLISFFEQPLSLNQLVTQEMNVLSPEAAQFIRDNYLLNPQIFIAGEKYTKYWYLPNAKQIIFWMTSENGLPIVDGTSEITLQLNDQFEIVSYTQTYQTDFIMLEEEAPHTLISAKESIEVLDARIQTNLPSNSTIIHVTLSYIRDKKWDGINIYLPVWMVVFQRSEGQTGSMFVDAIKGEVLTAN